MRFRYVVFNYCAFICSAVISFNMEDKIMEGESLYKELSRKVTSYGECWVESMTNLHEGCKHLTEEVQSRLALSFSNCFLSHAGSNTCPCPNDVPISVCLKNSSDRIFSTYTEFFTHTQSICHYLQHREWQEQTEKTVLKLTETSQAVSQKIDESSKSQSKILDLQQISMQEQHKLISNGRILNSELKKSRTHAKTVFEEFKLATSEHRLMIFEIFDRIQKLQNFILGEFSGVYTFAYYLLSAVVIYIMTSVPQTTSARIWLLILISSNAVIERAITAYSLDEEMLKSTPLDSFGPVCNRIWICRKITCSVGFMVLIVFYYRYKDYNFINNQLLREIQQQNYELQQCFKSINLSEKVQGSVTEANVSSAVVNKTNQESPLAVNRHTKNSAVKKRTVATSEVSTPKKTKHRIKNETFKEIVLKETSEDLNDARLICTSRYNLRSRVNSPQSPNRIKSPAALSNDIDSALFMHLLNKEVLEKRIIQ